MYLTEGEFPAQTEADVTEAAPQAEAQQETQAQMVWIPNSGSKYHSRQGCSNMKNPTQVTRDQAVSMGYEPCKKCY